MKHIFRKKMGFLIALFFVCNALQAQQAIEKPKVESYVLPNGFTVILQPDNREPKVQGIVVTRAGSINDPSEATGMAHYLEHMMFKGTTELGTVNWEKEKVHYDKILALYDELSKTTNKKQRQALQEQINDESLKAAEYSIPNELSKLINTIGGVGLNAGTSYDVTSYFSTFPSSQIERWLTIYAHTFQQPVFRGFQAELENVYEEYNMYSDRVQSQLNNEINKKLFKQTPYGRDIIGYGEHLKNPSLNILHDFFNSYYVAGNMALVLCGDFDVAKVKQMIAATFGKWEAKQPKAINTSSEAPFKGRETAKIKLGAYDMVQMAFRGLDQSNSDNLVMDLMSSLFSNGQSGLLDKYTTENKALGCGGSNDSRKMAGVFRFYFVPNAQAFYDGPPTSSITSQEAYKTYKIEMDRARLKGMEAGEKIILEEIENIKNGKYPDWLLETVKNIYINSFVRTQESIVARANTLAYGFAYNKSIDDYVNYIDKIKSITKEDISRVAKKYFTTDYMLLTINPGSGSKNAIEKPNFKPLVFPNSEKNSTFAEAIYKLPTPEQTIPYIDFDKAVSTSKMPNGNVLHYAKNPLNDLFSLSVRFGAGIEKIKELQYVSLLNYAGAGGFDVQSFKSKLAELNCSLSVRANDSYTTVSLSGPGNNLVKALSLLNTFINKPALYDNQVSRLAESERYARKQAVEEPEVIMDALQDYVYYGAESEYIDRLSVEDLRALKSANITSAFKSATEYEANIFYVGALPEAQIKIQLAQSIQLTASPKKSDGLVVKEKNKITENIVYLVDLKSLQSQVQVFANGKPYSIEERPYLAAFNNYMGGGFNGLVLQELREYRSLAYGAGAYVSTPSLPGKPADFYGQVQTQTDKTMIALNTLMDLVRSMPEKTDRLDNLKRYLKLSAVNRPDFRELPFYVESSKLYGYTEDPLKKTMPVYDALTFADITKYWEQHVKNQPIAVLIVGTKKNIDTKELSKYGKIVEIKIKDLFSKDDDE